MPHLVLVRPGYVPAAAVPYVLPRCDAGEAHATCICGGLLGYLRGQWHHVDYCLGCLTDSTPCPGHPSCGDPEPVLCTHDVDWSCGEPASVTVKCAYAREDQTCCGCCWHDAGSDVPRRAAG